MVPSSEVPKPPPGFTYTTDWEAIDPKHSEFEDEIHGFYGTAFDGRLVCCLPVIEDDQGGLGGEVVRYDTELGVP